MGAAPAFFQHGYRRLLESPNGSRVWWHSMPLPDGERISGQHPDKDLQLKMWRALRIDEDGGLNGRRVLDIGANDGFFSLAALMAGAEHVTALDAAWETWPHNIRYASQAWGVAPEIVTMDFHAYAATRPYDVIFFLGVLYHVPDVFACMEQLSSLLSEDGVLFIETQMSQIESSLPLFEAASDIYPTIAPQDRSSMFALGISNYLFPNEAAVRNLAYTYGMACEVMDGAHNVYTREQPSRWVFRLTRTGGETASDRRGPA